MIKSQEEAFRILETSMDVMPFEAIKYLYNSEKNEEILSKILFALENAYNTSIFYDSKTDYYSEAPLWYSIVAENHLDKRLIDPIIKVFTTEEEDWDFLNEQAVYVLGKLCKEYGDLAIEKCVKTCISLSKTKSEAPYLFLFESLDFAKKFKYDDHILELLKDPDYKWMDALISQLGDSKYLNILPRLKELETYYLKKDKQSHTLIEIREAINAIESNVQNHSSSYLKTRNHWETFYKKQEHRFKAEPTPVPVIEKKRR